MASQVSPELFSRMLDRLHQESLPYEPPIYPPPTAWEKLTDPKIVKRAWRTIAKREGPLDLYFHLPFCRTICDFCGLYARRLTSGAELDRYLDALEAEARMLAPAVAPRRMNGIRIGGGTPSLLSARQIHRLFDLIFSNFQLERDRYSDDPGGLVFEANPEFLTPPKLRALKEEGVNWIAMGVQTLDDKVLKIVNRAQKAAHVKRAYKDARKAGIPYIAFDLMYGLEGQTSESFIRDIETLIGWGPDRIVMYEFSPTARTPFARKGGLMSPAQRHEVAAMVKAGLKLLNSRGYKVNDEMHEYWGVPGGPGDRIYTYTYDETDNDGNYHSVLALGAGALSVANKVLRYQNDSSVARYQKSLKAGKLPLDTGVVLTPRVNMINYVILEFINALRLSGKRFRKAFGRKPGDVFPRQLKKLTAEGLVRRRNGDYEVTVERERAVYEIPRVFYDAKVARRLCERFGLKEAPRSKSRPAVIVAGGGRRSPRTLVAEMRRARSEGKESLELVGRGAPKAVLDLLAQAARKLKFRRVKVRASKGRR